MPRPKKIRKIINPPTLKGFRPIGQTNRKNPVVINFEEYEAIRLCDYELLDQLGASKIMGISRPTFTRIYESARRKVAKAFFEAKSIVFEGGKVSYDSDWLACSTCGCLFNKISPHLSIAVCPLCGSDKISESSFQAHQVVYDHQVPNSSSC
jgi:uncharacterized protein